MKDNENNYRKLVEEYTNELMDICLKIGKLYTRIDNESDSDIKVIIKAKIEEYEHQGRELRCHILHIADVADRVREVEK